MSDRAVSLPRNIHVETREQSRPSSTQRAQTPVSDRGPTNAELEKTFQALSAQWERAKTPPSSRSASPIISRSVTKPVDPPKLPPAVEKSTVLVPRMFVPPVRVRTDPSREGVRRTGNVLTIRNMQQYSLDKPLTSASSADRYAKTPERRGPIYTAPSTRSAIPLPKKSNGSDIASASSIAGKGVDSDRRTRATTPLSERTVLAVVLPSKQQRGQKVSENAASRVFHHQRSSSATSSPLRSARGTAPFKPSGRENILVARETERRIRETLERELQEHIRQPVQVIANGLQIVGDAAMKLVQKFEETKRSSDQVAIEGIRMQLRVYKEAMPEVLSAWESKYKSGCMQSHSGNRKWSNISTFYSTFYQRADEILKV